MTSSFYRQSFLPLVAFFISLTSVSPAFSEDDKARQANASAALTVTQSMTLDPKKVYGSIVIKASNIVIDGQGATILGTHKGDPAKFAGIGIQAEGVSGVTLKNIKVKGFETGLSIKDGQGWMVEGCDFSGNFHDPRFGWGENGRRGGIVLERVAKSTLKMNQAHEVWDACVLVESDDNKLLENDFSHTSNTCLKLWNSSRNLIQGNNLSYGIRKDPGEVHARDSTSVLIESGSNDNRFLRNDCTHGGDGIFIRVLNGWVSTGNYFEENDCSYANNNCVEAWSPRSTWIRNKANHGSYGFWLGASDQNVLIENEASFNGLADGNHNSPHLPEGGHAGIVFMFGPSSHTILRGNKCVGNNGAGIAAIGDLESKGKTWNAFHWIIEQNQLTKNRWGIYLQHADFLNLAANEFDQNSSATVEQVENVHGLESRSEMTEIKLPPKALLRGPSGGKIGQKVILDASGSSDTGNHKLTYRWQISGGEQGTSPTFEPKFQTPGFYRIALTVNNGLLSDLAWRDFYVTEDLPELGTEGQPDGWDWVDDSSKVSFANDEQTRLVGKSSLQAKVSPYSGGRVTLRQRLNGEGLSLAGKKQLVFWLKTRNENVPAWQDVNPLVTLRGGDKSLTLNPQADLLSQPPYIEAREGWTYFAVPLGGDATWKAAGELPEKLTTIELGFDSWGAPPLVIWVDGLGLK